MQLCQVSNCGLILLWLSLKQQVNLHLSQAITTRSSQELAAHNTALSLPAASMSLAQFQAGTAFMVPADKLRVIVANSEEAQHLLADICLQEPIGRGSFGYVYRGLQAVTSITFVFANLAC